MRISGLAVVSPVHLPVAERAAIDALIAAPCPDGHRAWLDYHGVVIESHAFGCFINTGLVVDGSQPRDISNALWAILDASESAGCDWVLVDRDEPPSPDLQRFDLTQGDDVGE